MKREQKRIRKSAPCGTTPHDFPAFGHPFFARYTLFDAYTPSMAALFSPVTPSESVLNARFAGGGPGEQKRITGRDWRVRERSCSPCSFKQVWTRTREEARMWSAQHHSLLPSDEARFSRRAELDTIDLHFQIVHVTGSAVRLPGDIFTPSAKRAQILSEECTLSDSGVCLRECEHRVSSVC